MFKSIKPSELDANLFTAFSKQWGVITVQCDEKVNGMTASWLQMGYLWNKNVVTIYVRPQRYTNLYMQKEEFFSVAFFDESYRKDLAYLGKISGNDKDKLKECNMTVTLHQGTPIIDQAKMVFVCRKMYQGKLNKDNFLDEKVMIDCYPEEDFHHAYVAEIVDVLIKE